MRRLVLALALACASIAVQAQSAAPVSLPVLQFFDNNGVPLAGGKIYTYLAGTSTPAATYKDSAASALNANPIILDAGGFANIWIGAQSYKFVIKNSADVQQRSADNVSNLGLQALAKTPIYQDPSGGLPQTINSGLTVNGDVTDVGHHTVTGNQDVSGNATVGGTQAVAGNATFGGTVGITGATSAPRYTSSVAIGTQPYATTSTTENANLNAQLWHGKQALDFSGTIDFASIASQTCLASTIAVTGAVANDPVAPSWPAALEDGLSGIMWVSAADTVSVRLCNVTVGAIDPASRTYGGRVVK